MLKAKDYFLKDIDTFINIDEFGEMHLIDGKDVEVIIDNDQLKERSKKEYDGISIGEILFYVRKGDLIKTPKEGAPMFFDNKQMYIFNVREDNGIYEIILNQNVGM